MARRHEGSEGWGGREPPIESHPYFRHRDDDDSYDEDADERQRARRPQTLETRASPAFTDDYGSTLYNRTDGAGSSAGASASASASRSHGNVREFQQRPTIDDFVRESSMRLDTAIPNLRLTNPSAPASPVSFGMDHDPYASSYRTGTGLGTARGLDSRASTAMGMPGSRSSTKPFVGQPRLRGGTGTRHRKKTMGERLAPVTDAFDTVYQKVILEGILRQKPLPPSADGRHVPLDASRREDLTDERRGGGFINNWIRSSRYTPWSFLPKQLYFQFSKLGNFYFLVLGSIQIVPGFSTTGRFTTLGPLLVFVAFSMCKEGYDDYQRYLMDKSENRSGVWVLRTPTTQTRTVKNKKIQKASPGDRERELANDESAMGMDDWVKIEWQDVHVGDVVRLKRDDNVPADMVLLNATGPNGIAYIETMALDGETNLKSKHSCPLVADECSTIQGLKTCRAEIVSEDPNLDLYNYEGKVTRGRETLPLSLGNIVFRGSTLRNTTEAIGLVVNSGEECKIRMNAHKHVRAKAPAMQGLLNKLVLFLIFVLLALTWGLTAGYIIFEKSWEANFAEGIGIGLVWVAYLLMFNTLIPLSLYISLEVIKIGQLYLLGDVQMYDPKTDTPMQANTGTILENLGQVSYVFSDKTGTLTENLMKFRKFSVAGAEFLHDMDMKARTDSSMSASKPSSQEEWTVGGNTVSQSDMLKSEDLLNYIDANPDTPFSKKAKQFLLCIALCHTALPETKEDGSIEFQASSPDEEALVEAARDLGFLLVDRPANQIRLRFRDASGATVTESYQVLDVVEFSSKRKRMSIIIRMPDGRICVYCKGADSVVLARLRQQKLAERMAKTVQRRASTRKAEDQDLMLRRMSTRRSGTAGVGRSQTGFRSPRSSMDRARFSFGFENNRRHSEEISEAIESPVEFPKRHAAPASRIDEQVAANEGAVFERTFQHIDDFASDGLRTLLFAYSYLDEEAYAKWRTIYQEATTSLVDRQRRIEEAGEMIERDFELAGATAIEDKLQDGVPATIDKLRRANIKVWMLTGDKRETAINIGYSAQVCKSVSEIYVLDSTEDDLAAQLNQALDKVESGTVPHTVVVVDGATLAVIEDDEPLAALFYDLMILVDSVICCRASPSQKANLVTQIRERVPKSMTLAIGDGANDIGMIQAAQVGIGISGREGLQAARISDYAIAQFRFLQRLLLVHGRWNYMRTGKYILATFWKEIVFFLVQAHYQRFNTYSGTSLYEEWSLTVFNALFTSLPVIILGIFDQDLSAETLLAVPELYVFGQRNEGFNFKQYLGWMVTGALESCVIFYGVWLVYRDTLFTADTSLFAMGTIGFTTAVIFINVKLLILELHHKTIITFAGLSVSLIGWFLWNIIISIYYPPQHGYHEYLVLDSFIYNFGRQLRWWATVGLVLGTLITLELVVQAIKRIYFPRDADLMQRIERAREVEKVVALGDAEKRAGGGGEAMEMVEMKSKEKREIGNGNGYRGEENQREREQRRAYTDGAMSPARSNYEYRPSPGFAPVSEEGAYGIAVGGEPPAPESGRGKQRAAPEGRGMSYASTNSAGPYARQGSYQQPYGQQQRQAGYQSQQPQYQPRRNWGGEGVESPGLDGESPFTRADRARG